jgi:predicted nucleic acid-binding protein
MRKIISNTTPILSLLKIGKLDLLEKMYSKIIIPKAVFEEIENGKEKSYYVDLSLIDWIDIREISNTDSRSYFVDLDDGEAEVLVLAKELKADLVIMDELMGRRFAKQLDYNLTGTIGVLLKAKENKVIPSIGKLLNELTEKGTWISPKLIEKVLGIAKEK